jgi:hypothetical protein
MEDRGAVSSLYPIYHLLSPAAEAALADGVREVGGLPSAAPSPRCGGAFEGRPDFSVRQRKSIALKSCCFFANKER